MLAIDHELLYDWFDALEQSSVDWRTADAADLIAYREAAALLERPTRELAQVRRLLQAKPIRASR
jgi:hypothetical protein